MPVLTGEELRLRELDESDIPAWFERATDAESADLAGDPVPDSLEAGLGWLQRSRDTFRQQAAIRWAIVPAGASASVGTIGLTLRPGEPGVADLGIVIGRAFWGKGIGTASARLVRDYAFEVLGLAQIQAEALQRNAASLRLLEKAGFSRLGAIKSASDTGGEPEDCYLYVLHRHGSVVLSQDEAQCQQLEALLADRIYEFNAKATGYFDGRLLAGSVRDAQGQVIAGFNGHTWGGCCELAHVWVHEQHRAKGLGRQLIQAAEAEALSRGCVQMVLSTHSFQAPGFYERMGFERKYALEGRPQGHFQIYYAKRLPGGAGR